MNSFPSNIGQGSIINAPQRPLIRYTRDTNVESTSKFGENVWIGANCVVGPNVVFENDVVLSDGSYVESDVFLGNETLITYRALVCSGSVIGKNCVIGGFIGENTHMGGSCRIFGEILHHHIDPTKEWDAPSSMEQGARLSDNVFIGFGAKVTRPVTIGRNVYVCPNAIVSIDIPSFHIVKNINEIISPESWRGDLSESGFFKEDL